MVVKVPAVETSCVVIVDAPVAVWLNYHPKFGFKWGDMLSMEYEYSPVSIKTAKATKKLLKRIIANKFMPKPKGMYAVAVKDGNELNLTLENLEWLNQRDFYIRKLNTVRKTKNPGMTYFGGDKFVLKFECFGKQRREVIKGRLEADTYAQMMEREFQITYK